MGWMLQPKLPKSMKGKKLFQVLGNLLGDCDWQIKGRERIRRRRRRTFCNFIQIGVDYGEIEKNQGQDYELKAGDEYFLANPIPDGSIIIRYLSFSLFLFLSCSSLFSGIHNNDLFLPSGDLARLGRDCMLHVLKCLDYDDLIYFASSSKSCYQYAHHQSLYPKDLVDETGFSLFLSVFFLSFFERCCFVR